MGFILCDMTQLQEKGAASHTPHTVPQHTFFPCGYSLVQFWGTLVSFLKVKCPCEHTVQWACLKTPPTLRVSEKKQHVWKSDGTRHERSWTVPSAAHGRRVSWPELQSSSRTHGGAETWADISSPRLWPQAMTLGSGPLKAVFWNINIQIGVFNQDINFS